MFYTTCDVARHLAPPNKSNYYTNHFIYRPIFLFNDVFSNDIGFVPYTLYVNLQHLNMIRSYLPAKIRNSKSRRHRLFHKLTKSLHLISCYNSLTLQQSRNN